MAVVSLATCHLRLANAFQPHGREPEIRDARLVGAEVLDVREEMRQLRIGAQPVVEIMDHRANPLAADPRSHPCRFATPAIRH
jgi:hypothetical protein